MEGELSGFSFGVSYFCTDELCEGGVVVRITLDCSEEVGVKVVDVTSRGDRFSALSRSIGMRVA